MKKYMRKIKSKFRREGMEQDEIGEKYIGNINCIYSLLYLKLDVMDVNCYNLYYFLCILIYFKIYNTLAHIKR